MTAVDRTIGLGKVVIEGLDLLQRTRIAVQQKARLAVRLREPVGNDLIGDLVTDITARFHDRPYLPSKWGIGGLQGAKDVTGRNSRDSVVLGDLNRLGAFAGPRRAHDEESH